MTKIFNKLEKNTTEYNIFEIFVKEAFNNTSILNKYDVCNPEEIYMKSDGINTLAGISFRNDGYPSTNYMICYAPKKCEFKKRIKLYANYTNQMSDNMINKKSELLYDNFNLENSYIKFTSNNLYKFVDGEIKFSIYTNTNNTNDEIINSDIEPILWISDYFYTHKVLYNCMIIQFSSSCISCGTETPLYNDGYCVLIHGQSININVNVDYPILLLNIINQHPNNIPSYIPYYYIKYIIIFPELLNMINKSNYKYVIDNYLHNKNRNFYLKIKN